MQPVVCHFVLAFGVCTLKIEGRYSIKHYSGKYKLVYIPLKIRVDAASNRKWRATVYVHLEMRVDTVRKRG